MVVGAEKMQDQQVTYDENGNIIFKHEDDPRVTRIGRFIRRTSLDELPQLLNVLQGTMSLVGPRPELPMMSAAYELWQHKRFAVPQGMTGWWQINGRADKRCICTQKMTFITSKTTPLLMDYLHIA